MLPEDRPSRSIGNMNGVNVMRRAGPNGIRSALAGLAFPVVARNRGVARRATSRPSRYSLAPAASRRIRQACQRAGHNGRQRERTLFQKFARRIEKKLRAVAFFIRREPHAAEFPRLLLDICRQPGIRRKAERETQIGNGAGEPAGHLLESEPMRPGSSGVPPAPVEAARIEASPCFAPAIPCRQANGCCSTACYPAARAAMPQSGQSRPAPLRQRRQDASPAFPGRKSRGNGRGIGSTGPLSPS